MVFGNAANNNVSRLQQFLAQNEHISSNDFNTILTDAISVFTRCQTVNVPGSTQGLIYGNVQSGKTAVILAFMAYAMDHEVRNFIVLTSDLNDLYRQTLSRIQLAMNSAVVLGKSNFNNAAGVGPLVPIIFVSSKNTSVLNRLNNTLRHSSRRTNSTFAVIDDEADQASLNTNMNAPRPPSGVNQGIVRLRGMLNSYTFIQTTATPQALMLQNLNDPFKPSFVVVTTPGEYYTGGNLFFGNEDFEESDYLRIVPGIDVTALRQNNGIPQTVAQSLYLFFAGAASLRLSGRDKNFTYLLHTSLRQADHERAATSVRAFVNDFLTEFSNNQLSHTTMLGLENAYLDLRSTFQNLPPLQSLIDDIRQSIPSTRVAEINARTGGGVEENPTSRHTIYIGATKIGRGVTVKNLLITYYGRDAQNPQMDTVLQHARMYGYRQPDLPSIRIFLPRHLAQRFYDIHRADDKLRNLCRETHEAIPVLPLRGGIRPTRRNVLNQNTVELNAYIAGSEYFPTTPYSSSTDFNLEAQTASLDHLLREYETQRVYPVSIDDILRVLSFRFCLLDSPGAWDDELIRQAVTDLKNDSQTYNNRATLVIVNRSSNINKARSREYEQIGSVMPGGLGNPPFGIAPTLPAIFLFRLNGNQQHPITNPGGWDGIPFWVPNVRFPDGNYVFAVNYST
jgi:Z1 domain